MPKPLMLGDVTDSIQSSLGYIPIHLKPRLTFAENGNYTFIDGDFIDKWKVNLDAKVLGHIEISVIDNQKPRIVYWHALPVGNAGDFSSPDSKHSFWSIGWIHRKAEHPRSEFFSNQQYPTFCTLSELLLYHFSQGM